jgi:hypothetical protein
MSPFWQKQPSISLEEVLSYLSNVVRVQATRQDLRDLALSADVDEQTLRRHAARLALFGVFFSLKFSRVAGWRELAQQLFSELAGRLSREFDLGIGEVDLDLDAAFHVYGLAVEMSRGEPGRVKTELGKGLCQILGKNPHENVDLQVLAGDIFTAVGESVVVLQKKHRAGYP